jgi:hypothetical protein
MVIEPPELHLRFHSASSDLPGPGPRRAAQVLAGCLALVLATPADVLAAPATPTTPVQAPAGQAKPAKPPRSSAPSASATPTPAPSAAPTVTPPVTPPPPALPPALPPASLPSAEPSSTPADISDSTTQPAPPPPAPAISGDAASAAIADAAWEGVDGIVVIIELKGGRVLHGRVGAVQSATFTLIDGDTGQILVIPKTGVSSLRAYVPPPVPTQTGIGLLAGGGILLGLGIPVFITGVTFVAICPDCTELHLPMLIVGGGALGGGIPMIVRGGQRRSAFQKALLEQRISPVVSRTPYGGWHGGLQIRF